MPKDVKCRNCNNLRHHWCEKVTDSPDEDLLRDCPYFWEKTRGDMIRAMSDEELANFLSNWGGCNKCKFRDTCTSSIGSVSKICKEIHLEWLKQTAEGE